MQNSWGYHLILDCKGSKMSKELVKDAKFLKEFTKFTVPLENEHLIFYRSEISGRWWVEIPNSKSFNNKLNKHSLLPCSHQDYLDACNQLIPERWYKAYRKNEI